MHRNSFIEAQTTQVRSFESFWEKKTLFIFHRFSAQCDTHNSTELQPHLGRKLEQSILPPVH